MRRSISSFWLAALILVGCVWSASSQSRKSLEDQRMKIIKEIEMTSKKLKETQKDKEVNLGQIAALEEQIQARKSLIENLQAQADLNEALIEENRGKTDQLQQQHVLLTDQYKKILRASYLKKMANTKWAYILSATNLNNLILRWRYLHQLDEFTEQKIREIERITGEIKTSNDEIAKARLKNLETLEEAEKNMELLESEQKERDAIVKKLSGDEKAFMDSIKKNENERERLNTAIEKIIVAELERAKEMKEADKEVARKATVYDADFAKNKGSLDWPVTSGKITGFFGTHPHPTIKSVQITNNGVDFSLPSVSEVTSIFDGDVVGVIAIPGYNNMVIVRHGSYYSVYSKLENVYVAKDDNIKRGQKIGKTAANKGNPELHFELWHDRTKLNPQQWLRK